MDYIFMVNLEEQPTTDCERKVDEWKRAGILYSDQKGDEKITWHPTGPLPYDMHWALLVST